MIASNFSFERIKLIDLFFFLSFDAKFDRRIIFLHPLSLMVYTLPLYWDMVFGKYMTTGEDYAKESSSLN